MNWARAAWVATAFMAVVAVLLWLNLKEVDFYELGSLTPVDGAEEAQNDLRIIVPLRTSHPTPGGGTCEHALEVVKQRRTLTLRDRDGWYRVFWAVDDVYYYKELVHLAADLRERDATDPRGTWTLMVQAAAGPCGTSPGEATVTYTLLVTADDLPLGPPGPLGLPSTAPALAYQYAEERMPAIMSFAWVLQR